MYFSLIFVRSRGCDGKGSLHEPHGGSGLWPDRPSPGSPAPGGPGWAWAGAERVDGGRQSVGSTGVGSCRANLHGHRRPLLAQTRALKSPRSSVNPIGDAAHLPGVSVCVGAHVSPLRSLLFSPAEGWHLRNSTHHWAQRRWWHLNCVDEQEQAG